MLPRQDGEEHALSWDRTRPQPDFHNVCYAMVRCSMDEAGADMEESAHRRVSALTGPSSRKLHGSRRDGKVRPMEDQQPYWDRVAAQKTFTHPLDQGWLDTFVPKTARILD